MNRDARILLIEDNHLIRQMLVGVLKQAGYAQVREASDGYGGLRQAENWQPDLVSLDMFLPDIDGVEVLTELKRNVPEAKVLVLTARHDRETVQACVKGGAGAFIIKPFEADVLLKTIERLLEPKATPA
ncbi:MAG: response regulator [Burkholderiales bacterium]|nr:response regulator [Burkholderiales bacterium]